MRVFCAVCVSAVALLVGQAAARAFFFDRPSFNAAISGLPFESFESNPQAGASVVYGDLTFTETNGTNFITHTAINTIFTAATTDGSHSIWFDDNDDSVAVIDISLPINAIGFDAVSYGIPSPGVLAVFSLGGSPCCVATPDRLVKSLEPTKPPCGRGFGIAPGNVVDDSRKCETKDFASPRSGRRAMDCR